MHAAPHECHAKPPMSDVRVQRLYFDGDMDASVANTGQVAGRIEDIPPAADIIKQMWAGCREVLAATADRLGSSSDGS